MNERPGISTGWIGIIKMMLIPVIGGIIFWLIIAAVIYLILKLVGAV